MPEKIAYKILTQSQADDLAAGRFHGAPIDQADGYIHLSTAAQLDETAARHFAGQDKLFIAAIDLTRLGDALRWEASRHGQLFPHLYGALTMGDVLTLDPLTRDPGGRIRLTG